ncbi:unnamed protein product [Didymodactylos carnosus]|uniref:Phage tail collar domain-containing protein n=1 Tax=Didymodactylos carnosus TaxID=1234261 RepID=A0A815GMY2_9BILA|nr:unnamed protein product [Didymodactylos carnosus]CAF1341083.1 unnamed protein product [Didymodactylos carnosus]CAF3813807.1 unnamed protein product [Didymodactylos carnosus]CAF4202140.1 unnamed protein product [Didymodactylos carnosus]
MVVYYNFVLFKGSATVLPIGTIILFTGQNLPEKWLGCDGSEVSRIAYPLLFSVIASLYGDGDHVNTFNLPDFRGRFPLGIDRRHNQNVGLNQGGNLTHTLSIDELPWHLHDQGT